MTDNPASRGTAPQRGVGPEVKRVKVISTPHPDTGYIDTLDEFGKVVSVAPLYQVLPNVDEDWVITKAIGPWSFAARLTQTTTSAPTPVKPVVRHPSRYYYDDPTTTDLVNALEALGLITVNRS